MLALLAQIGLAAIGLIVLFYVAMFALGIFLAILGAVFSDAPAPQASARNLSSDQASPQRGGWAPVFLTLGCIALLVLLVALGNAPSKPCARGAGCGGSNSATPASRPVANNVERTSTSSPGQNADESSKREQGHVLPDEPYRSWRASEFGTFELYARTPTAERSEDGKCRIDFRHRSSRRDTLFVVDSCYQSYASVDKLDRVGELLLPIRDPLGHEFHLFAIPVARGGNATAAITYWIVALSGTEIWVSPSFDAQLDGAKVQDDPSWILMLEEQATTTRAGTRYAIHFGSLSQDWPLCPGVERSWDCSLK